MSRHAHHTGRRPHTHAPHRGVTKPGLAAPPPTEMRPAITDLAASIGIAPEYESLPSAAARDPDAIDLIDVVEQAEVVDLEAPLEDAKPVAPIALRGDPEIGRAPARRQGVPPSFLPTRDGPEAAPSGPVTGASRSEALEAHPHGDAPSRSTCTAAQLRRFIKSRVYVPMHELRRRFAIEGTEDEVSPVDVQGRRVFLGLPPREASLVGELLKAGDVGYELSLDPVVPIVVGVYPMRPVLRG